MRLVLDRGGDEVEAERVQFGRRRLDVALDLVEGEGVGVALVPVGLAVEGVEGEAGLPPRRASPAAHQARCGASAAEAVARVAVARAKLRPVRAEPAEGRARTRPRRTTPARSTRAAARRETRPPELGAVAAATAPLPTRCRARSGRWSIERLGRSPCAAVRPSVAGHDRDEAPAGAAATVRAGARNARPVMRLAIGARGIARRASAGRPPGPSRKRVRQSSPGADRRRGCRPPGRGRPGRPPRAGRGRARRESRGAGPRDEDQHDDGRALRERSIGEDIIVRTVRTARLPPAECRNAET